MNSTIEKFITEPFLPVDMAKDSELVREVEDFLKEKGMKILEMEYDRDYLHLSRPAFSILTDKDNALEKLANERKAEIINSYDERSRYKLAHIKNDKYDIYITVRGKPF